MRWQTTGVIVPKWTTTKRMHIVLIHWIYFMCANYSIVQGTGFSEELHIDIESWMWSAICLSFACRDNSLVWLNVEYVYDEWLFVHLYATRQVSEWMGKHPTRRRAIPFHSWTIQGAMFRQQIFRAVTCGITTANIHSYSIKTINVCGMVLVPVCVCVRVSRIADCSIRISMREIPKFVFVYSNGHQRLVGRLQLRCLSASRSTPLANAFVRWDCIGALVYAINTA